MFGLARSILASSLLLTLIFNEPDILFRPAGVLFNNALDQANILFFNNLNFFFLLPYSNIQLIRVIAILILLLVISGRYIKITCFLHAWLAVSFINAAVLIEGGDQIAANISILLIPICLVDDRKSHWDVMPAHIRFIREKKLIAAFFYWIIRLQVALIYFHAAVGKMFIEDWVNGTAIYYWFNDPTFGMTPALRLLLDPIIANPYSVVLLTWGTIILEILLFTTLVMDRKYWKPFFVAGILFHISIILVHGLFSFFITMAAALFFLVGPVYKDVPIKLSLLSIRRKRDPVVTA
ncbi:antimicrobial peptide system protein, SdpB family [Chitinophaga terrae (ex Kim and Jung 2007)]|uniref:Antimicrobial peptide system protein, SdpB family n=2 Tax=Chitinophaga terrae (ex Kim and Jung 2007) TaxID=408074 RepID=A0A1H4GDB1_9BACT|nr:antimicrobial peptide system protein, SdpB family [Chitinophaga terrae (ex Kim and Jung 2007)]